MDSPKYKEQHARVERYLDRFREINSGTVHDRDSQYYEDDTYAFFINCHHLKDWIINKDKPVERDFKGKVESFIENNDDLKICADLCNGFKHLVLRGDTRRVRPTLSDKELVLNINEGLGEQMGSLLSMKWMILTDSGDKDAFELAERCVKAWKEFINRNL